MTAVHVVAHTHWDREWYLTREQFRLRLVDLVDAVLDRLEAEPGFRFHLDGQTVVLEDYLEVRPEAEDRLRRHVSAGRLLVGPWYVMPDMFLVSGEALLRNLEMGHRVAARFGAVMAVGYVPDPFGHVAQMPQILRRFGLDAAVLWRGLGAGPAERWWEGPDGSRVLLLHLPTEGYCNALRLPWQPRERLVETVSREAERSTCGQVLLMAGVDHVEPHPGLDTLVQAACGLPGVTARLGTLPEYVDAVRAAVAGADLEVVRGELRAGQEHAFLLPGVLSTRQYLKQANAAAQRELEHWAEPASVLAWLTGGEYPQGVLDYAWRTLLQNHPHDSICGCSVDAVHEENMARYARVQQAAEEVTGRALRHLALQVAPAPPGLVRCLLANTHWRRFEGVLEATLDLPYESAERGHSVPLEMLEQPPTFVPREAAVASVAGPGGEPWGFQVLSEQGTTLYAMSRYEPPWALRARRIRLVLRADVPPLGYTAVDVRFGPPSPAPVADPVVASDRSLENAALRVAVNEDGTFDVLDKRSSVLYRRCLELEDGGDVGDEYTFCPPAADTRVAGAAAPGARASVLEGGPLRGALRVDYEVAVPTAASDDRRARTEERTRLPVACEVRLAAGSPRLDVILRIDNRARDHRLRVLLPTGARAVSVARADSAFALMERAAAASPAPPAAKEEPVGTAPLLSVVDAGDETTGMSAFVDGLTEYEVVAGEEARLALTLLRCVGFLSRDDLATREGHAGPGLATPGAQCPGSHTFRFALAPRAAPPAAAALFAEARDFLSPPRVVAHAGGAADGPASRSLLEAGDDVVLSACVRSEDGAAAVLRVFNPGGEPARGGAVAPGRIAVVKVARRAAP